MVVSVRRGRSAFTLIEVLVAICLVAVMLALVLSGIQAARESARKAACSANLRQIGIALGAYHTSVGSYPHTINGKRGHSIHAMILPYLENAILFNSLNYAFRPRTPVNNTALRTVVPTFLCPSDSNQDKPFNNYVANTGYGYQTHPKRFDGMFTKSPLSPTRLSDVSDGASNTAMMSEAIVGTGSAADYQRRRTVYFTPTMLVKPAEYEAFISACQTVQLPPTGKFYPFRGSSWAVGSFGYTLYSHDMTPNGNSCLNHKFVLEGAWTASSWHSSAVNVLFADGHVRRMSDTIAPAQWRALGTRAGHEINVQNE